MAEIGIDIDKAAAFLKKGKLVAIPTETVYGLAANALDENAVRSIYEVKNRPLHNPLILHLADKNELLKYVEEIPTIAHQLMEQFCPGPLTFLLPKTEKVPSIITHGLPRVAVRIPNHPMALKLLKKLPFPLAAPSANPSGYISPTQAQHVQNQIGDKISYILDGGNCEQGIESTIIGFKKEEVIIYRLGAIAIEEIEKITPKISIYLREENNPNAPGMLLKHYSPRTPFILTEDINQSIKENTGKRIGLLLFAPLQFTITPTITQKILSDKGDMKEAAAQLYAAMHELDARSLDVIIAERFPKHGIGKAINDRLERAAAQ